MQTNTIIPNTEDRNIIFWFGIIFILILGITLLIELVKIETDRLKELNTITLSDTNTGYNDNLTEANIPINTNNEIYSITITNLETNEYRIIYTDNIDQWDISDSIKE